MSSKTRTTEAQVNKGQRPKQITDEVIGQSGDPVALSADPGIAFGSGSVTGQAVQLASPRWQLAQRRALASRIGRVQGNDHVKRLVASLGVATEPLEEEVTTIPSTEPLEEEVTTIPSTEPLEEEVTSPVTVGLRLPVAQREGVLVTHSKPKDVSPAQRPPPVLVPVDASRAGACVICNGGNFAVWINPAEPTCTVACMRKHEEKHIADFKADDAYKNKCASTPDGETFYYASAADAKRFEHPAIDIEIACINKQLETETDEGNKKILKHRAEVTLPAYRRSFG